MFNFIKKLFMIITQPFTSIKVTKTEDKVEVAVVKDKVVKDKVVKDKVVKDTVVKDTVVKDKVVKKPVKKVKNIKVDAQPVNEVKQRGRPKKVK